MIPYSLKFLIALFVASSSGLIAAFVLSMFVAFLFWSNELVFLSIFWASITAFPLLHWLLARKGIAESSHYFWGGLAVGLIAMLIAFGMTGFRSSSVFVFFWIFCLWGGVTGSVFWAILIRPKRKTLERSASQSATADSDG
tara:strand:- start:245 stop:667 length:423 start_codon:yes stop_codon:yes gene_type:complete